MRVVARKQGRASPLSPFSQIAKLAHRVVAHRLASGRADGEASMSVLALVDLRRAGGRRARPLRPLSRCCPPCAPTRRPNLSEESGMLLRCRFDASSQTSALRDQSAMPGRCASGWYGGPAGWRSKQSRSGSATVDGSARGSGLTSGAAAHARYTASRPVARRTKPNAFSANRRAPRVAKN